jgi:hypothetical protein
MCETRAHLQQPIVDFVELAYHLEAGHLRPGASWDSFR